MLGHQGRPWDTGTGSQSVFGYEQLVEGARSRTERTVALWAEEVGFEEVWVGRRQLVRYECEVVLFGVDYAYR